MKRIITCLIAAMMLIGCLPVLSFAAEGDPVEADYGEAELVFKLGILDSATFDPAATPTRGELTAAVMRAANYPVSDTASQYFVDVPASHAYAKEINTAAEIGFVNPGSVFFEPDEPATVAHAAKMLVWITGYDIMAQNRGGYPTGYLILANELEITKGVGDTLTYEALLNMLLGALKTEILEQSQFGDTSRYQTIDEHTLLAYAHDIYRVRGVVTENSSEALPIGMDTVRPRIAIDGVYYDLGDVVMPDYLEYRVVAYYKELDNQTNELYYILPDSRNVVETVDADDVEAFTGTSLEVDRDGDTERISVDAKASIIYNGEYLSEYEESDIMPAYGKLTLVDPEGDGSYNTIKVSAYQTVVVQGVNTQDERIYGKYDGVTLDMDADKGIVRIVDASGAAMQLADVSVGDVLTAEIGKGGLSRRVTVSSKTVSGTVSEVATDDEESSVLIGENTYLLVPNFPKTISVGREATFSLDVNDRIADFASSSITDNVAVFIQSNLKEGISEEVQIKMFTADGQMTVATLNDKVKLDGETVEATEVRTILNDQRQVIVYKTNSQGLVNEIDTKIMGPQEDPSNALIESVAPSTTNKLRYKNAAKAFSNKMIVDDEGVFFLMPPEADKMDDSVYEIIGTNYFSNDLYYAIGGYHLGENRGLCDVVTVELTEDAAVDDNTPIFVLDHISEAVTEDGETKPLMYGYRDGSDVQFFLESEQVLTEAFYQETVDNETVRKPYKPAMGDVLKLAFNSKNEIKIIEPVYSVAEHKMVDGNPTYTNFDHVFRVVHGFVEMKDDAIAKVTIKDPAGLVSPEEGADEAFVEMYNLDKFKIYRVTLDATGRDGKKVEPITAGDVLDYVHNGNSRSEVVLHTRYGEPKTMVVYE